MWSTAERNKKGLASTNETTQKRKCFIVCLQFHTRVMIYILHVTLLWRNDERCSVSKQWYDLSRITTETIPMM